MILKQTALDDATPAKIGYNSTTGKVVIDDLLMDTATHYYVTLPLPTAHYKMNDNAADSVVADVYSNDGTYSAYTTTADRHTTGKVGSGALNFDGMGDFITVPGMSYTSGSEVTFAFWAKVDTSLFMSQAVIGGDSGSGGEGIEFDLATHGFTFATIPSPTSTPYYFDNSYHHFVFSVDANSLCKLYIDGLLFTSWTITGYQSHSLTVIGATPTPHRFFKGELDDIRYYQSALTADQAASLYNANLGTETEQPNTDIGYSFPTQAGVAGQVLTAQGRSNACTWETWSIDSLDRLITDDDTQQLVLSNGNVVYY